jgi:cellulose synthase/poly-beta-1,6-N-acetylglucosamine synthase-like glycosyltransferase
LASSLLRALLGGFNLLALGYFVILNTVYLVTSVLAFRALRRYARQLNALGTGDLVTSGRVPPITLIAPAFNEEATCVDSVHSLLMLEYPNYEILLVNDGSADATFARLTAAFDLFPTAHAPLAELPARPLRGVYRSRRHPNLWVIDKENGGKADALNAGLNYCRTPLFCALDVDSLLERDALQRLVRPFVADSSTIAAGGILRLANGCKVHAGRIVEVRLPKSLLAKLQVVEYLRAFLAGRMGWDEMNATLVISGAFGLFHRATVVQAGGYTRDTVGEDMELVVRLHRYCRENGTPYRISFVPDPVAWTEAPESLRVLGRQRDRWQRGLVDSLWRHRRMLLNPRYGRVGLIGYPYFFFLEMLGPLVEITGYFVFGVSLLLGIVSPVFTTAFLLVAIGFGTALSIAAVALEELTFRRYPRFSDLLRLFLLAVVENLGFRQLITYWRARGIISWFWRREEWGRMERKGFTQRDPHVLPVRSR